MAQYNLVGYNAAPTNPEYDITSQGLSQIPRTNWAEYSLKKEEMRENKKLNRIKTAVDTAGKITSMAATGVDMYQTIDQMDLKKESLKLDNNLKSLDIRSKTVDVANKEEQSRKDLEYTTKIRELQKAQDWAGLGALVLSDIETAQRNSGVTKSIIEQLKFNKVDQADQLFATLFPDEQYKRDQDTLNRQQAITLKSMEINALKPLRESQITLNNAKTEYYNTKTSQATDFGMSPTDMKKATEELNKATTKADNVAATNPTIYDIVSSDGGDPATGISDALKNDGDIQIEDIQNVEELVTAYNKLKALNKESDFPSEDLAKLNTIFRNNIPAEANQQYIEEDFAANKNRLLRFTNKEGVSKFALISQNEAATLMAARNAYYKHHGQLAPIKLMKSDDGDISGFSRADLFGLSKLSDARLQQILEKHPNFINTATPAQQQTSEFQALANTLQRVNANTSIPQGVAASNYLQDDTAQSNLNNMSAYAKQMVNSDPSKWNMLAGDIVAKLSPQEKQIMAVNTLVKQNGFDINNMSPEQKTQIESTLRSLLPQSVDSLAKQHLISLAQKAQGNIVNDTNNTDYGQLVKATVQEKKQLPEGISITNELNKLSKGIEDTLDRASVKKSEQLKVAVDANYKITKQLLSEIKEFIKETGQPVLINPIVDLPKFMTGKPTGEELGLIKKAPFFSTFSNKILLDSPEAVDNYIKFRGLNKKNTKDMQYPHHILLGIKHVNYDLAEGLDSAINRTQYNN